jgi:hypothetical protein
VILQIAQTITLHLLELAAEHSMPPAYGNRPACLFDEDGRVPTAAAATTLSTGASLPSLQILPQPSVAALIPVAMSFSPTSVCELS